MFALVPGSSGRLHPAGVGEGSSVSMGQQPGAGGCLSVASWSSLQSAGRDPQPCSLRQVSLGALICDGGQRHICSNTMRKYYIMKCSVSIRKD